MNETKTSELTAGVVSQMKELVEIKESFKPEQLKFIKGLINPDLTDNELYMFLAYAGKSGLNPFNKEIIAVVYNGQSGRTISTIVTRDGKRATAYRKGGIESIKTEPIYIKERIITSTDKEGKTNEIKKMEKVQPWEGGILWGATCTVVRNGKEYNATVPFKEYNTGRNVWAGKPETMIKKVAESQALSMAVPELLGIYDESEMPTDNAMSMPVASEEDSLPATEMQKKTVSALAAKHGVAANPDEMTQLTAKAFISGLMGKDKTK